MAVIQFYHLRSTPLERALPKIVEKAYAAGFRVQLLIGSAEQMQVINDVLWTFSSPVFLPHGSAKEPHPERQPIYLATSLDDAPNDPNLLFVTEGSVAAQPERYTRIVDMFDGNSEQSVAAARQRWKRYKQGEHSLSYFRQNDAGAWEAATAAA